MSPLNACTIVSKNYLPFARVLARSFQERMPGGRFFVLLVDRNEDHIDEAAEPFTLVSVEELDNISELPSFLFKYTILECNTAVKPFFLEHLFERHGLDNLVYFDPDILITGDLGELTALVESHAVVLTPHLTDPVDDGAHPGELAVLQAGSFNLGFIALGRMAPGSDEIVRRLLTWWQERLYDRCVVRIGEGLFVDQKWMDLAPGLFKDVHVLHDPGYNVAYWNLHGRPVEHAADGAYRSAGRPLVFFHFSGIVPENLQHVSKHQDRFTLEDLGDAADLYRHYSSLLLDAGWRETRSWPYAFATFDNGVRIPDVARRLYLELGRQRRRFGDPFTTSGDDSFLTWLLAPHRRGARLSRILWHLYRQRDDLLSLYPDVDSRDHAEFCSWLWDFGRHEFKLDEAFLEGVHRETRVTLFSLGGLKRRARNRLKRLYHSDLGKRTRLAGKRMLGTERYQSLRRRLRPAQRAEAVGESSGKWRLPMPRNLDHLGVNLIGYLRAETGMGEAARALARAFESAGVPVAPHNLDLNVLARQDDPTFAGSASHTETEGGDRFPYPINLLVVNADQILPVCEHLGREAVAGRFNVGFWLWELETFPEHFRAAFDPLHEVWTPSAFCADAIARLSPLPVRRVPIPVELDPSLRDPAALDRAELRRRFGLPEDSFVFLFIFNFLSYFERKNPLGLVRAFKKAFPEPGEAHLVLKVSQSDFAPAARQRLEEEIGDAPVILLDEYYSRDDVLRLIAAADAYVSLHRSEGFGLTLAEAMLLERPVIATAYSGNVDFFDLNVGHPVRFRVVELDDDAGPYPRAAVWAEPDEEHAAELLRLVYDRQGEAADLARRGRGSIERQLSHAAVGWELERRIAEITRRVHRDGARLLR